MADRRITVRIRGPCRKSCSRQRIGIEVLIFDGEAFPASRQWGRSRNAAVMRIPGAEKPDRSLQPRGGKKEGRQNRAEGKTQVAAEVKHGYGRGLFLTAHQVHGFESLGVVTRLAEPAQGGEQEDPGIGRAESDKGQPQGGDKGARREQPFCRPAVGEKAEERLDHRRSDIEGEQNGSCHGVGEVEGFLEKRGETRGGRRC